MADLDSNKLSASGVDLEYEREWGAGYCGRAENLIACGLIKREWLPGEIGNGKSSQRVAFALDGSARLIARKQRIHSSDTQFGWIEIQKSGALFHVRKIDPATEIEKRKAASAAKTEQEIWNLAKDVRQDQSFLGRWKQGVLYHIEEAEGLISGRLVFDGLPDFTVNKDEAEVMKSALSAFKAALARSVPRIKETVVQSNIIALNDYAYRAMKKEASG